VVPTVTSDVPAVPAVAPAGNTPAPAAPAIPGDVIPPAAAPVTPAQDPATPPAPAEAPTEEEFEVSLADDSPLPIEQFDEIVKYAEEKGLDQDATQRLISESEKAYRSAQTATKAAADAEAVAQAKKFEVDPEFSGEARIGSWQSVGETIETFADADFVQLMQNPVYGNNIVIARFLKRIGDAMKPEGTVPGRGTTSTTVATPSEETARLQRLYPKMFPDAQK
jgi:hypothetical protein